MSKYSIDSTTLSAIGDAIKTKKGNNSSILVSNFANEITNLPVKEEILSPFVCQNRFQGHIAALDSLDFCFIPIPKSIIQKYTTISFTYSLYSVSKKAIYDIDGTNLTVYLTYANEGYNWKTQPDYNSFIYSNSDKISDIVTDFTGSVSSTYNLNCASILNNWPTEKDRSHVLIVSRIKNIETNNNPSCMNVALIGMGEFEGSTL